MVGEGMRQRQEDWLGNYCNNPWDTGSLVPSGCSRGMVHGKLLDMF